MNDEFRAGQTEMPIRRPSDLEPPRLDEVEPHGIGQRQSLIRESSKKTACVLDFISTDLRDGQRRKVLDKGHELEPSRRIVATKKPGMPLGQDERGRDKRWSTRQPVDR